MSNYPDNFSGTPYDGPDDDSITDYEAEKMAKKIAAEFAALIEARMIHETGLESVTIDAAVDFAEQLKRFIHSEIVDAADYHGRYVA
jgi:hypothetical protein